MLAEIFPRGVPVLEPHEHHLELLAVEHPQQPLQHLAHPSTLSQLRLSDENWYERPDFRLWSRGACSLRHTAKAHSVQTGSIRHTRPPVPGQSYYNLPAELFD